jgi:hypothetical protein
VHWMTGLADVARRITGCHPEKRRSALDDAASSVRPTLPHATVVAVGLPPGALPIVLRLGLVTQPAGAVCQGRTLLVTGLQAALAQVLLHVR